MAWDGTVDEDEFVMGWTFDLRWLGVENGMIGLIGLPFGKPQKGFGFKFSGRVDELVALFKKAVASESQTGETLETFEEVI